VINSRSLALAVLATAQLLLVLDITVVNIALPDIGGAPSRSAPWPRERRC